MQQPSDPAADRESGSPALRLTLDSDLPSLIAVLPVAAYLCDSEGLIVGLNPSAEHLWGRAPDRGEQPDRFSGALRLFTADGVTLPHEQCEMALTLRDGRERAGHRVIFERPDGTRVTVLAHAKAVLNDLGTVVGAISILVEVEDRAPEPGLARLARELSGPLEPIFNSVAVLSESGDLSPLHRQALAIIERQATHLRRIVDDLLEPARASAPARSPAVRVLVVDDLTDIAESTATLLRMSGYDARVANSGPQAVEAATVWAPRVILLDVGMPGMDGFEVVRTLRASSAFSDTWILAMTGYATESDRRRTWDAGFDEHLVKPVDQVKLEGLLASLLVAPRRRAEPDQTMPARSER